MESPWNVLWLSVYISLVSSLFGLPFTLGLAWVWALALRAENAKWLIPTLPDEPERRMPFLLIAILGGVGGDFAAVNALSLGEWWICRTQHRLCNEGQGGIMLIFTVPILAIVGALVAWGWTWLTLRIPPNRPWASVFRYSGSLRWLNWLLALAIPAAFWVLVTLGLIRVTL